MTGVVESEGLKELIKRGYERGFVTHDDIRACVPECTTSDKMLADIARLLDQEDIADVFVTEPTAEERKRGRIAIASAAFKRGVGALFPDE